MALTEPVILSAIGGGVYQILPIIENWSNPKQKNKPTQINVRLIVVVLFYVFVGGLLGYAYFDDENAKVNKFMAVQIGLSAPLILRAIGSTIPKL